MKYSDWCVDYYKKTDFCAEVNADKKRQIRRNITEKLIPRLYCLTGKYYGEEREFDSICYTTVVTEDEIKKKVTEHYQKINGLKREKENEIRCKQQYVSKMIKRKKGMIPDDELRRLIKGKNDDITDLKEKCATLENCEMEDVNVVQKRFAVISKTEAEFFEFLLEKIPRGKMNKISNDEWECLEREDREIIILYLHEVNCSVEWQLTEDDIKEIEFKLRYPVAYRLMMVQDVLETDSELANNSEIREQMCYIRQNVDSLYETVCKREVCVEKISREYASEEEFVKVEYPWLYYLYERNEEDCT